MKIVKVKSIPVRYEGTTYQPDEQFEMKAEHVNENIVEVTGEVERKPKTVEDMTVAELKDYAEKNEIDLGEAKKRDDILEAIQSFEADPPAE